MVPPLLCRVRQWAVTPAVVACWPLSLVLLMLRDCLPVCRPWPGVLQLAVTDTALMFVCKHSCRVQ
jgi:hypothetical protein